MPVMNGLEFLETVRADPRFASVKVMMVTTETEVDQMLKALAAGADEYVMKPASPENLRARLQIAARRIAQDDARRVAEAALARARWLAWIGETTIALEHEINNPLSALLGHAELLLMGGDLTAGQREQLDVIREQGTRIAGVVRRLARLKDPRSVEYVAGARMTDLSSGQAQTD